MGLFFFFFGVPATGQLVGSPAMSHQSQRGRVRVHKVATYVHYYLANTAYG